MNAHMAEAAKATTTKPSKRKHAGGRPTKLTKAAIDAAREYVEQSETFANSLLPTVERLAINLNVHRDTLYEWKEQSPEFSDILGRLLAIQADKLIQNGLQGRYNAPIAKMLLSAKHGYVEKQATDLTTNGKELPAPILGGLTQEKAE